MPSSIAPKSLDFLDGFLFRVMVNILKSDGSETGLFDYYEARIRSGITLSLYDRAVFDYVLKHFDRQNRRIVHAGIGAGTLTSILAVAGYHIVGIERNGKRFEVANRIREALADAWPHVIEHYDLLSGVFPATVEKTNWIGPHTVLIFTNCGAGWTDELTTQIIETMAHCGDTILDARLFGKVRHLPAERQELLLLIEAQGLVTTPISETPPGTFYYHVQSN